jgi:hypothetical protein
MAWNVNRTVSWAPTSAACPIRVENHGMSMSEYLRILHAVVMILVNLAVHLRTAAGNLKATSLGSSCPKIQLWWLSGVLPLVRRGYLW